MGTLWGRLLICSLLIGAGMPIVSAIPIFPGNFTAHFINVGQGDAIFLITPDNNTTLIDSGPNTTMGTKVSQYIQESGLNLDVVIATHSDADHIGGMQSVLAAFTPQAFVDSPYPTTPWTATYQDMRDAINQSEIPYVTVTAGSSIPSYQGLNISILNPQGEPFPDTNDNSIVFRLQYGSIAFLFTGDAEHASENVMMNNGSNLQAQILKVGEHGSSSSSSPAFLARVEPEVAVIEVGAGNQYHHPANETLENLTAAGARIYRTDLNGTVVITTDGSGYTVLVENPTEPIHINATSSPGGSITPSGVFDVPYGGNQEFTFSPEECFAPTSIVVNGTTYPWSDMGVVFSNLQHDLTLYVQFELQEYHVIASSNQGGMVSPASQTINCSRNATIAIVPNTGYVVSEITDNGQHVQLTTPNSYVINGLEGDHNVTVVFGPVSPFSINATAGPNGVISPSGLIQVSSGSNQTFVITPGSGYSIADVKVDNSSIGSVGTYTFSNVTANHTIHATFFSDVVWIIQATPGEGGMISPNGNTPVINGQDQAFTITPNAGHEIVDVIVDDVSVGNVSSYTFTNVTANHTISATFIQTVFVIIAEVGPDGMGTITPDGVVDVSAGVDQTFIITPDPGEFDCWGSGTRFVIWNITVDGVVIQGEPSLLPINYTFTNVSANHTILVNFAEMIIDARPMAKFNATPRSGFVPLPVHFSQVRVSNNTGLLWSFGDNSTSTDQNPNHTYSAPGMYNVSLTIYCDDGSFTEEQPGFIQVKRSPPPVGGDKGYFLVHSNVEGAQVFFDNDFKGNITNGTLNVSVYVTATPYRTYTVEKSGYNGFTGTITQYPGKGGTVDLYATLTQGGFFNFNFHFVDFPALRFVNFPSFYPF